MPGDAVKQPEREGGCGAMGIGARRMLRWAIVAGLVRRSGRGAGETGSCHCASGVPFLRWGLIKLVLRDGLGSRKWWVAFVRTLGNLCISPSKTAILKERRILPS